MSGFSKRLLHNSHLVAYAVLLATTVTMAAALFARLRWLTRLKPPIPEKQHRATLSKPGVRP